MKIQVYENGKSVLYVQISDIILLNQIAQKIPISVYTRIASENITAHNEEEFMDFDEPHEIRFFKSLDTIVDYKEMMQKPMEEINEKVQSLIEKMNTVKEAWKKAPLEVKKEREKLWTSYELLNHKCVSLQKIIDIKEGKCPPLSPYTAAQNSFVQETKQQKQSNNKIKALMKQIFATQ